MRPAGQPAGGLLDASAQTRACLTLGFRWSSFRRLSDAVVGSVSRIDLGAAPGRAPAPLDAFCACTKGRDAVRFVLHHCPRHCPTPY
jgi:hypothetical protein